MTGPQPAFPPRLPDRNDLDWKHRDLDDGYDYKQAATAGAYRARQALAGARPPEKAIRTRRARPDTAQRPSAKPDAPWTPHDTVPTTFTPGHWADGTPMPDDVPEEDR